PRDGAIGDEVVLRVLLPASDPDAEGRDAEQVGGDDESVECVEAPDASHPTLASRAWDLLRTTWSLFSATSETVDSRSSGASRRRMRRLVDNVRFHREILRQPEPVELRRRPLVPGLDALPELSLVVPAGEGRRVLLRLMLEDRLDLEAQLFLRQRNQPRRL